MKVWILKEGDSIRCVAGSKEKAEKIKKAFAYLGLEIIEMQVI